MGIFDFLKKKSGAAASKQTVYMEKDNVGTRHASMSQAVAYWMGERPHLSVKPQFTMYDFPSADAAEEAMLELPFIHKAADSGKLICDRLMTFGYYAVTSNGVPTGEYEAVVIGNDLTLTEYNKAEEAFARHGGKC